MSQVQIIEAAERWETPNDNWDDAIYHDTKVIFRDGDASFWGRTKARVDNGETIDTNTLFKVSAIDLMKFSAPAPPSEELHQADLSQLEDVFVKKPSLLAADIVDEDDCIGENLLSEAKFCEIMSAHPQPHIVPYYGVVVEKDRIIGLAFKKCRMGFRDRLWEALDNNQPFDRARSLDDITSGIKHLHSLGIIHNDLNPANIMIDEEDRAVIIDFDSCQFRGEKLGNKKGTFMWADDDMEFALEENDTTAIKKIEEWLKEERPM